MSALTSTERSKPQPSKSPADYVELEAPAGGGVGAPSGRARFDIHDPAAMRIVAELQRRGYTVVPS